MASVQIFKLCVAQTKMYSAHKEVTLFRPRVTLFLEKELKSIYLIDNLNMRISKYG